MRKRTRNVKNTRNTQVFTAGFSNVSKVDPVYKWVQFFGSANAAIHNPDLCLSEITKEDYLAENDKLRRGNA